MFYKKNWLVLVILLALVFLATGRTAIDTDLWWHLRAGEETVAKAAPLLVDRFSSTAAGVPWVNHSWLAQVIFYALYKIGDFVALGGFVAVISCLIIGILFIQLKGSDIFKAFVIILGTIVASVVLSPRPQIFSLLLMALTQYILYLFKCKKRDYLWWLPVLFVLWSNLHGGYPLGLLLIAVWVAGEIANRWLNRESGELLEWRQIRKLVGVGLACAAAVIINPNGLRMWLIPFQTVEVKALQNLIEEWASPNFHELIQQSFLWLLFAVLVMFALNRKRIDSVDILAVIVFGYMGFLARRNMAPFAMVATPILSRYAWNLVEESQVKLGFLMEKGGVYFKPWQKILNLTLVAILFSAGLFKVYLVNHPVFISQTLAQTMPVGALDWVRQNKPAGNMLNEYNWGGFLSWELRGYPIFIDGRTDLYGDKIISEWLLMVSGSGEYQVLLDDYHIGFTILSPSQPVISRLLQSGWEQAYRDDISIVLTRPIRP